MEGKPGSTSIDRGVLECSRQLEVPDGRGLPEKVLTLYLADSLKHMERIRDGLEAKDAGSVRRSSHSLKSSSGNVGAAGLSEICRKIEEAASAGVPPAAGDFLIDKLEEECRWVREELKSLLDAGNAEATGDR